MSLLALVYIHLQMQIIDLAYQGKDKEGQIKKLSEVNGQIAYQIYHLTSAHHIGSTILSDDQGMQFAKKDEIVQIVSAESILKDEDTAENQIVPQKGNPLISFLSSNFQREARAQE